MKVLGIAGKYDHKYICEVEHSELAKFLNQYYSDNLKELRAGDEIDLGTGHDFLREIKGAFKTTQEFIKSHQRMINIIMRGIDLDLIRPEKEADGAGS